MIKQENQRNCSPTYSSGLSRIIQLKIVNAIFSTIFLLTGIAHTYLFPGQKQIGELLILIAALSVFFPILINGVKGFFVKNQQYVTEQLVMFATIALIINGDLIAATIIPIIMVVGHLLEEKSIIGIEEAINSLKNLASKKAHLLRDGAETEVEINSLKLDDQVVVYPGETVPIDGTILSGESLINQAHVTGESASIEVNQGHELFAGTINISGKLTFRVTRISSNTLLSNIVSLLKEAGDSKVPIVKIIEQYLELYFPLVIMIAAITLFFTHDISRLVTVLVISCPCAFVLASPSAMIAALVVSSRRGIMIRNSAFIEALASVDTLIFDKTGTVTTGEFEVIEINAEDGVNPAELLIAACVCASGSMHPISVSVIKHSARRKISFEKADKQEELHGRGVKASESGRELLFGKYSWVSEELKIQKVGTDRGEAYSSVWVAADGKLLGEIVLADTPRPDFAQILDECRKAGVKELVLLTGDKKAVGDNIGKLFCFDEILSECLPQDKLAYVQARKSHGEKVMFVGDGINDALALKASDVGVAIGQGGADIAIQSSDITIKSDSLVNLPSMFHLSKRVHRTINQNILIGTGFSMVMVVMAAMGVITPVWGAIAHNLGTFFVLINSAGLLNNNSDIAKAVFIPAKN